MDDSQERFGIIEASALMLFAAKQLQLSYLYKEIYPKAPM